MTDLDALFAIDRECFEPGIAYSRAQLGYFIIHPRSLAIAAEDESTGAIAGFAIAETYLQKGTPVGHIITIDVRASSRRKGLGRLLMEEILSQLSAADAATVTLEVAVDNAAAQAFYQRLGFSQTGRIPGYYMGKLDALVMEKGLSP